MTIVEALTFDLGPYTVKQRPRFDNPAFAVYKIFRGTKFVAASFSRPDEGCCRWLELQKSANLVYAEASRPLFENALRGAALLKTQRRKREAEARKRAEAEENVEQPEAIEG